MYNSVQGLSNTLNANSQIHKLDQPKNQDTPLKFKNLFKNALENVNQVEQEADKKTAMLALGKDVNLHDVMISSQKAAITIDATVQIQQKVIDAYNEVMRMQI